ncbi:hypothetical protein [Sphingomonas colocasiae]|uniref:AsmA-like C-terminal domain-containing protein n=1 Tax=Sphingomonas colocasiae TaxID=1848973 RepID=A0ABS7PR25_9SPHN|nr:hypothetical protein [Sphingomonas colocasiae]MBY8823683.1 hypothetical protein [Sphingomonas colocasiae]
MRVVSSLADIDFTVGRVRRESGNLVIESGADSTLETTVTITPRDARHALGRLIGAGAVWGFLPAILFGGGGGETTAATTDHWEERRKSTGLNKPW